MQDVRKAASLFEWLLNHCSTFLNNFDLKGCAMSRKWTEERLLGVLAYRPFITVSHFDATDEGKRKCAIAAMREGSTGKAA